MSDERLREQQAALAAAIPMIFEVRDLAEAAPRAARTNPVDGEPLAATDLWRTAVRAAGLQCECAGTCGKKHTKSGGRCDAGLHKPEFTRTNDDRLYVTKRGTRHVAMCASCTDGHARIDKRLAKDEAEDRLELYALPGLELPA